MTELFTINTKFYKFEVSLIDMRRSLKLVKPRSIFTNSLNFCAETFLLQNNIELIAHLYFIIHVTACCRGGLHAGSRRTLP